MGRDRRKTARTAGNVVNLRPFVDPVTVPTVVMIDLQQEYVAAPRRMAVPDASAALAQCSLLLTHARAMGFPVAFMKWVARAPFFNAATRFSQWIEGFSPLATEMVFERELPSCYANSHFARVMDEGAGGNIVLAGFAGEFGLPVDGDRRLSPGPPGDVPVRCVGQPRARCRYRPERAPSSFQGAELVRGRRHHCRMDRRDQTMAHSKRGRARS